MNFGCCLHTHRQHAAFAAVVTEQNLLIKTQLQILKLPMETYEAFFLCALLLEFPESKAVFYFCSCKFIFLTNEISWQDLNFLPEATSGPVISRPFTR